jgi:hypothetical protein
MIMRFGIWDVRNMYRAGLFRAVAEEVSKYKLDFVGVQEVRWDGGGTEPAGEYTVTCLSPIPLLTPKCDVFKWYTPLIRRVLVLMIGFISSWVTPSLLVTLTHKQYSAIAYIYTLQFTVAHALGFSLSTRRLLATDFDTELPQSHNKYYT